MNLFKDFNCIVTKRFLLLEAAIIWTIAGSMLLFRGSVMLTASTGFSWIKIISCLLLGVIFFRSVFSKISRKHVNRIINLYGDCHLFSKFFSGKSYLMMLMMISMGIFLRKTAIVPVWSLSLAYLTMGVPLLFSSFRFYYSWYYYLPVINSSIN